MRRRLLLVLPIPALLMAVTACRDAPTALTDQDNALVANWNAATFAAPEAVVADPTVSEMIAQVSQSSLLDGLEKLTGREPVTVGTSAYTFTTRSTGSGTPIEMATQYAFERFQAAGLDVGYQSWTTYGLSGRNVIAERTGTVRPGEILLVTAHIDDVPSWGPAPGADDNGTGCEAVMTLAELIASRDFERTVRFVIFTGEEQGMLGSRAYARSVVGQDVVGNLNLEMLGWDGIGQPTMRIYTRRTTSSGYAADRVLADAMAGVISTYGLPLVPLVTTSGRSDSDHSSFWSRGMAAVAAAQDAESDFNPYYHTSQDNVVKINLPYFTSLVKAVVGTAAHLAVPSASCEPLAAPTNLIAAANSSAGIDLGWSPVPGAAGYRVYRSVANGGPYTAVGTAAVATYADIGLAGSTTYYYVVRSFGTGTASCESASSDEASATTAPAPPVPTATLTASPTTIEQGQTATLTWQTTDATTATMSGLGEIGLNGSQTVTPSVTTTFQLAATGAGGTATATAVVTVTAVPPAGSVSEIEPNGSRTQANPISTSGTSIVGTVGSAYDSDYFRATLPGGATLVADLIVPADKNYDIRIYSSRGWTLARGTKGTGQAEHVTYRNTSSSSRTVYVRVYGYRRAYSTTAYQLNLAW